MQRDIFSNISPLDHRYTTSNPQLANELSEYLSENAYVRYQARVEAALTEALADRGLCSQDVAEEVKRAAEAVLPEEVYRHEAVTRHNIRALVNAMKEKVSEAAKPFIHLSATSVDIMDTARSLQYKTVSFELLLPLLRRLQRVWLDIAEREAGTLQAGRTHGQHAVPITFGFAVAQYVDRLGNRIEALEQATGGLRGKMAGAVGAYNASSLFFADAIGFEKDVLAKLGLKPGGISTQIVEPEYILDFVHGLVSSFGVLANFADDIRHLQRTEISEVGEAFEANQVGSSTMPHKRNPWNFEHVKSMWKVFTPRMMTVYMDQISEHQRDLTNSASSRFIPEIVAGLALAADRLTRICQELVVDAARMGKNFGMTQEMIVAEPLYILLAAYGHPDAHEVVRKLTLEAEERKQPLPELVRENAEIGPYLEKMTPEQRELLAHPARYTGQATEKTLEVCKYWQAQLSAKEATTDDV